MKTDLQKCRILWLIAILALSPALSRAESGAAVQAGRQHLAAYKQEPHAPAELAAADQEFQRALAEAPDDIEANVYRAATRLMLLLQQDPVRQMLTDFGWSDSGRNHWKWEATLPPTLPDPALDSADATRIWREALQPAVDEALAGLARIPADWNGSFPVSSNELPFRADREVDAGDVAALSYGLHILKAWGLLNNAYDKRAVVERYYTVGPDGKLATLPVDFNRDILERFPVFGTVTNAALIPQAEKEFQAAADAFDRARRSIEAETDPQKDDVVTIEMIRQAEPFVASLRGPREVSLAHGFKTDMDARRIFQAPYLDRTFLPQVTDRSEVRLGTFPDPAFGGLFPGMTQARWSELLQWMPQRSGTQQDLFDVAAGPKGFVAVGDGGIVLTSPDALEWQIRSSGGDGVWKSVCCGGGFFVAVGDGGRVAVSPDGAQWLVRESGKAVRLEDVAFAKGRFVAVGENGTILISNNGQVWEAADSGTTENLYAVAAGEKGFIAVGSQGVILLSPEGQTWQSCASGRTEPLLGVSSGPLGLVAVGQGGLILTSPDGVKWTTGEQVADQTLQDVCEQNGQRFAVGAKGVIAGSRNDQAWVRQINRSAVDLWGVAAGAKQVVAVGSQGRILVAELESLGRAGKGGLAAVPPAFGQEDVHRELRRWTGQAYDRLETDPARMAPTAAPAVASAPAALPPPVLPAVEPAPVVSSTAPAVPPPAVSEPTVAAPSAPAAAAGPALVLAPAPARAGRTVAVTIHNFPAAGRDPNAWIGFYTAGTADDRNYLNYTFLKNLNGDLYDVPWPDQPGRYEFRLFQDGGYNRIATSDPVVIP